MITKGSDVSEVILGQDLGERLIEKLGLPDRIGKIDIRLRVGEPVTITVERLMGADEGGELETELLRYELTEKSPEDDGL